MIITKHSKKVAELTREFTTYLGYDEDLINQIVLGSALHDIGKAYLPNEIFTPPRKLTEKEFELVKMHPELGHSALKHITNNNTILNIGLFHHERCDGTGYPYGLKEGQIPKEAMIVAIIDVFEALISERHYKGKSSPLEALSIIKEETGSHFNKEISRDFVDFVNIKYDLKGKKK